MLETTQTDLITWTGNHGVGKTTGQIYTIVHIMDHDGRYGRWTLAVDGDERYAGQACDAEDREKWDAAAEHAASIEAFGIVQDCTENDLASFSTELLELAQKQALDLIYACECLLEKDRPDNMLIEKLAKQAERIDRQISRERVARAPKDQTFVIDGHPVTSRLCEIQPCVQIYQSEADPSVTISVMKDQAAGSSYAFLSRSETVCQMYSVKGNQLTRLEDWYGAESRQAA